MEMCWRVYILRFGLGAGRVGRADDGVCIWRVVGLWLLVYTTFAREMDREVPVCGGYDFMTMQFRSEYEASQLY
jgi:hypothetical protein